MEKEKLGKNSNYAQDLELTEIGSEQEVNFPHEITQRITQKPAALDSTIPSDPNLSPKLYKQ